MLLLSRAPPPRGALVRCALALLACAGLAWLPSARSSHARRLSSRVIAARRNPRTHHPSAPLGKRTDTLSPPRPHERHPTPVVDEQLPRIASELLRPLEASRAPSRSGFLTSDVEAMLARGLCLEIGPKDIPALPPTHPNARFLDQLDQRGLKHKHAADRSINLQRIPFIHYVWTGALTYSQLTGGKRFQLVIASHVAEHVPDFVAWLMQIAEILTPDGVLRLVVPDKRYCFDFRRRLSSFADILEAHIEKRTRPSVAATYDNYARVPPKHNSAQVHWNGSPDDYELTAEVHANAYSKALRAVADADWGVHSWQWSTHAVSNLRHHIYIEALRMVMPAELASIPLDCSTGDFCRARPTAQLGEAHSVARPTEKRSPYSALAARVFCRAGMGKTAY